MIISTKIRTQNDDLSLINLLEKAKYAFSLYASVIVTSDAVRDYERDLSLALFGKRSHCLVRTILKQVNALWFADALSTRPEVVQSLLKVSTISFETVESLIRHHEPNQLRQNGTG